MIYYDFYYLWAGGRLALDGASPYDVLALSKAMHGAGWPADLEPWGFVYPPWFLCICCLFGAMPFAWASFAWASFNFALSAGIVYLLADFVREHRSPKDRAMQRSSDIGLSLLAFLCFPAVIKTLLYGQSSLLLGFAILGGLIAWEKKHYFLSGFILAFSLFKPHLALVLYFFLFLWSLRTRNFKLILGGLLGLIAQALPSWIIYPQGFVEFLSVVPKTAAGSSSLSGATISQLIGKIFQLNGLSQSISLTLLLASIMFIWRASSGPEGFSPRLARLSIVLSCISAPYAFMDSFSVLLLPYFVSLQNLSWEQPRRLVYMLCLFALLGIAVTARIDWEPVAVVIPWLLLFFGVELNIPIAIRNFVFSGIRLGSYLKIVTEANRKRY